MLPGTDLPGGYRRRGPGPGEHSPDHDPPVSLEKVKVPAGRARAPLTCPDEMWVLPADLGPPPADAHRQRAFCVTVAHTPCPAPSVSKHRSVTWFRSAPCGQPERPTPRRGQGAQGLCVMPKARQGPCAGAEGEAGCCHCSAPSPFHW